MSEELETWARTLSTNPDNRKNVVKLASEYCLNLPEDKTYSITIELEEETRRKAQNDLMWAWNAEAGKAQGHSADYQHGLWKLSILLPLQKGWKRTARRAQRIQETLDCLPTHELRIFACYDMVRSKGLSLKNFAEGLTAYQQHYAEQGIQLRSRQDLINEALGEQISRERAA